MQNDNEHVDAAVTMPERNHDRDELQVLAVLEGVNRGFLDRDASAILAHFEDSAIIFDLAPPLSHGLNKAGLEKWFQGWAGPVERKMCGMTVEIAGNLAIARGLYQVIATTADGHPASWWMRATIVLRREGDWRISHEHTSVPFHMDGSFKAALDLQP